MIRNICIQLESIDGSDNEVVEDSEIKWITKRNSASLLPIVLKDIESFLPYFEWFVTDASKSEQLFGRSVDLILRFVEAQAIIMKLLLCRRSHAVATTCLKMLQRFYRMLSIIVKQVSYENSIYSYWFKGNATEL